jgi:hypothetical protein
MLQAAFTARRLASRANSCTLPVCSQRHRLLAAGACRLLLTPRLPALVVEAMQAAQQQQLLIIIRCRRQQADRLTAYAARLWHCTAQLVLR